MSKAIVVSCEQGEETFTIALVHLDTKKLQLLNFEVAPVKDFENNWALNKYPSRCSKYDGLMKFDSKQIKERLHDIFCEADCYFVRNKLTLNILTGVFKVPKGDIYVVNNKLSDVYGLRCVSCGDQTQSCAFYDVIAMTNLICNQDAEVLPKCTVAAAGDDFKFASEKFLYKTRYTINSAVKEKCVRLDTLTEASSDDDSE
jgi:ribosomal protein S26